MTKPERGAFLDDAGLRGLLVDSYVTPRGRGDDGPGEYFRANGVYQRGTGWGMVFEGRFDVSAGAICVEGNGATRLCRRVRANGDGTYTFINTADGTATLMTFPRSRGAPLNDSALHALLTGATVADFHTGQLMDGPAEFFLANRDGSYTFIDSIDGTSPRMTVTRPRLARPIASGPVAESQKPVSPPPGLPLNDAALRTFLVDAYAARPGAKNLSHPPMEIFRADGLYRRVTGRISYEGRFEIRDGMICVHGDQIAPQCRRVIPDTNGTYSFVDAADGAAVVMEIHSLR